MIILDVLTNPWVITSLLAASPIGETRASIIYGVAVGLDPALVFFLSILINIAIVPPLLLILRRAGVMHLVHKTLGKHIAKTIHKFHKKFELYEELALMFFVAIPLPLTGVWTASLITEVLDLDRRKAFFVIALGAIIAAGIVLAGATGTYYALTGLLR